MLSILQFLGSLSYHDQLNFVFYYFSFFIFSFIYIQKYCFVRSVLSLSFLLVPDIRFSIALQ